MMGKILYNIERKQLSDDGYIVDAKVFYISLSSRPDLKYKSYRDIYEEYIINNIERNQKIVEITQKQVNKGLVLILITEIEHGKILYDLLGGNDNGKLDYVHGSSKDRYKRFKKAINGETDILVCTSIMDEGITLPRAKTAILGGAGKSFLKTVQKCGRILGTHEDKTYAEIFDFKDSVKYFDKHYYERRKILEEDFEVVDQKP